MFSITKHSILLILKKQQLILIADRRLLAVFPKLWSPSPRYFRHIRDKRPNGEVLNLGYEPFYLSLKYLLCRQLYWQNTSSVSLTLHEILGHNFNNKNTPIFSKWIKRNTYTIESCMNSMSQHLKSSIEGFIKKLSTNTEDC